MSFKIAIRDNARNKTRVLTEEGSWNEGAEFRWTEGNESCDCNREALFYGSDSGENECSDGKFTLMWVETEEGKRINLGMDDFTEWKATYKCNGYCDIEGCKGHLLILDHDKSTDLYTIRDGIDNASFCGDAFAALTALVMAANDA